MKLRLLIAFAAVLMVSGSVFAATQQDATTSVQLAPIVATLQGWDTGLTVINVCSTPLTVTNFTFYSLTGASTALPGKSYSIPGMGRMSMLASEIAGVGLNGTLKYSIIGPCAIKALSYQAVFEVGTFNVNPVPTKELTKQ